MKMISSAKMHKAEMSLRRLQPFRRQVESIIGTLLTADAEFSSPLLEERPVAKVTIVVFGSDDGLCGAYNNNIFKALIEHIGHLRESFGRDTAIELYPIGKKMLKACEKLHHSDGITVTTVEGVDSKTSGDGVRDFADSLCRQFAEEETDRVDCLYMGFHSVSRQRTAPNSCFRWWPRLFRTTVSWPMCAPAYSSLTHRRFSRVCCRCSSCR